MTSTHTDHYPGLLSVLSTTTDFSSTLAESLPTTPGLLGPSSGSSPLVVGEPDITSDPAYDPFLTSSTLSAHSLHHPREISLVEHSPTVGVTFNPPLYEQRTQWVLDVLRRERVGSVLDVGCGEGRILEALCQPAGSIPEEAIGSGHQEMNGEVDGEGAESAEKANGHGHHSPNKSQMTELFIHVSLSDSMVARGRAKQASGVILEA